MANSNSNQFKLRLTLTVAPIQETTPATQLPLPCQGPVNSEPNAADTSPILVQIQPAQPIAPDGDILSAEPDSAGTGFNMNELLYHEDDNVQQPSHNDWQTEAVRIAEGWVPFRNAHDDRKARAFRALEAGRRIAYTLVDRAMVCHVELMMMCMLRYYSCMKMRVAYTDSMHPGNETEILQSYPHLYAMFLHLQSAWNAQRVAEFPNYGTAERSETGFLELTMEMFRHSNLVNTILPPSTYSTEFPETYAFSVRHPATEKDEARATPEDYRGGITLPLTPFAHILTAIRTVFVMLHEYCDKEGIHHKWTLELGPGHDNEDGGRDLDGEDGEDGDDWEHSRSRKRVRVE